MKIFVGALSAIAFLAVVYLLTAALCLLFIFSDVKTISNIKSAATAKQAFSAAKRIKRNLKVLYPLQIIIKKNQQLKKDIEQVDILISAEPLYREFFASDRERAFIAVMQNNAELRPSGGFWGSYGDLSVSRGSLVSFNTYDTYDLDQELIGKFPPPEIIKDLVGNEWRFWNANWSPDFRISAEQGLFFLKNLKNPKKYDGVVATNINFILELLKISGPVKLNGYAFEISDNNFLEKMVYEPNSSAIYDPSSQGNIVKSQEKNQLLAEIGKKSLEQIFSRGLQKQLYVLALESLENRDLILYSSDENIQRRIEQLGWGGRFTKEENFIMAVDANFGSKLDLLVEKNMTITKLAQNRYEAKISYKNQYDKKTNEKQLFVNYRNLLRIYLPKEATVLEMTGGSDYESPTLDIDIGANYISNLILLEPNESDEIRLVWEVPEDFGELSAVGQTGSLMKITKDIK